MVASHTAHQPQRVAAGTVMTLLAESEPISVSTDLRFDSRDPFAVNVVFLMAGTAPVEWVFARDLLIGGIRRPVGNGDVRVTPLEDGRVCLDLASPGGRARLLADADEIADFVHRMLDLVPVGKEQFFFDIDDEIADLLSESPQTDSPQI